MKSIRYFVTCLASLAFAFLCLTASTPNGSAADSARLRLPGVLKLDRTNLADGPIIVKLRLEDGEELPLKLDTGGAVTFLDESLVPKLGRQIGVTNSAAPFGETATLGIYSAPKLYAGDTQLLTGPRVYTVKSSAPTAEKGLLCMDCLCHYCIQFDFAAGKMVFLDPERLDPLELGKPFPLKSGIQGITCFDGDLFGQGKMRFLLDTGWAGPSDGMIHPKVFDRLLRKYQTSGPDLYLEFPDGTASGRIFPSLDVCGQTYTDLRFSRGYLRPLHVQGVIGMRFLARHKVTLNFPKRMLYLKYITGAPLTHAPSTSYNPLPPASAASQTEIP